MIVVLLLDLGVEIDVETTGGLVVLTRGRTRLLRVLSLDGRLVVVVVDVGVVRESGLLRLRDPLLQLIMIDGISSTRTLTSGNRFLRRPAL